jgi:hypothetical protein
MNSLTEIDLCSDPLAGAYVKDEVVMVAFASAPGIVGSREGANRFGIGDALITGSTGDRWSVSRARFDAKYEALPPLGHGETGRYRSKRIPVLAKQMAEDFCVARSAGGDVIRGQAGDWLMQYAPGDYGIVEQAKFAMVYRPA